MPKSVFISYESHNKDTAFKLCSHLESNGISCWIAPRDVHAGDYAGEITRAIRDSKAIVVIISNTSQKSNHVRNEVTLAFNNHLLMVPYCLDDKPLDDNMAYFLASKHRIISCGNTSKDFQTITDILSGFAEESFTINQKHPEVKNPRKGLISAVITALIAIIAIIAVILLPQRRNAPTGEQVQDSFSGQTIDGFPHGTGTLTFGSSRLIDLHDDLQRSAEAGDYITGEWDNGHLIQGKWFDRNGKVKDLIIIGKAPNPELDHELGRCQH